MSEPQSVEPTACPGCGRHAPVNPCYRTRHQEAHAPHIWRNGIEVQYDVRCPGYVTPPGKP